MARREVLIPALDALSSELPAGQPKRELQQVAKQLDSARDAADLTTSVELMRWLPLLLSGFSDDSTTRLTDLVAYASEESQNRRERRRLLAYPLVLLLLTFLVFAFLCLTVVPTFGVAFKEFGLRIPTPTRIVLFFADQMQDNMPRFLITVIAIAAAIYGLARLWTHFSLTTRLFGVLAAGNSANVSAMSSLTSQLADLLSVDVSLPDALWIAGNGCQHYQYKRVAEQLARHAHSDAESLSESPVAHQLPANLIFALQAGDDGDPSVPMLRTLSAIYRERASSRVDWSTGAMTQLAIVLLGLAIGFVVLALFSPLVSLVSGLS